MEQSDDKKHPHDDWHMYATKLSKVTKNNFKCSVGNNIYKKEW